MAVDQDDFSKIKDAVNEVGEAADKIRGRSGVAVWVQGFMAVATVVVGIITAFNNRALEAVKSSQEALQQQQDALHRAVTERQADEGLSTSVLHETMLILDTQDKGVLKQKVIMHEALLTTLIEQSAGDPNDPHSMRSFYTKLRQTLPFALPPADAQELSAFNDSDQYTEEAPRRGVAPVTATSSPAPSFAVQAPAPPPAAAAAPVVIQAAGLADLPGNAQGWDLDVFWCVGASVFPATNKNEVLAAQLLQALAGRQSAEKLGRLRLRRLPEIVNQSPAYGIRPDAIAIRVTPDKQAFAAKLKSWLDSDLKELRPDTPVRIEIAHNRLPFYVPVFVCTEN